MSKYFCTMPEILTCPNLDRSLLFAGITVISKLGVRQRRVKCFSNARHFSIFQRTCAACCRAEGASHVRKDIIDMVGEKGRCAHLVHRLLVELVTLQSAEGSLWAR